MTIIIDRRGILGDVAGELARLEALAADLEAIASGVGPTSEQIESAPLIDHWVEFVRTEPCLAGRISGHPHCHGPTSITSGVWVWAPELGWARTLSRFYRLGRPKGTQPSA